VGGLSLADTDWEPVCSAHHAVSPGSKPTLLLQGKTYLCATTQGPQPSRALPRLHRHELTMSEPRPKVSWVTRCLVARCEIRLAGTWFHLRHPHLYLHLIVAEAALRLQHFSSRRITSHWAKNPLQVRWSKINNHGMWCCIGYLELAQSSGRTNGMQMRVDCHS
jgi:hypothetical protein